MQEASPSPVVVPPWCWLFRVDLLSEDRLDVDLDSMLFGGQKKSHVAVPSYSGQLLTAVYFAVRYVRELKSSQN